MKRRENDKTFNLDDLASKRQPFWMSFEALFDFPNMPDWKTLLNGGYLFLKAPKVRFFVSHPWESTLTPDPTGNQ